MTPILLKASSQKGAAMPAAYPQSPLATAPLEFPPNGYVLLTGKDDLRSIKPRPSVEDQDRVLRSGNLLGK